MWDPVCYGSAYNEMAKICVYMAHHVAVSFFGMTKESWLIFELISMSVYKGNRKWNRYLCQYIKEIVVLKPIPMLVYKRNSSDMISDELYEEVKPSLCQLSVNPVHVSGSCMKSSNKSVMWCLQRQEEVSWYYGSVRYHEDWEKKTSKSYNWYLCWYIKEIVCSNQYLCWHTKEIVSKTNIYVSI